VKRRNKSALLLGYLVFECIKLWFPEVPSIPNLYFLNFQTGSKVLKVDTVRQCAAGLNLKRCFIVNLSFQVLVILFVRLFLCQQGAQAFRLGGLCPAPTRFRCGADGQESQFLSIPSWGKVSDLGAFQIFR